MLRAISCFLACVLLSLLQCSNVDLSPLLHHQGHVCRSPDIFAEDIEHRLHRAEQDIAYDVGSEIESPDAFYPTKGGFPMYESHEDCTQYQYRPIRLRLVALMNNVKPFEKNTSVPLIWKYQLIISGVLREFNNLFQVPFDHVGRAGDVKVADLVKEVVDIATRSTLNNYKIDMAFVASFSDPKKLKQKLCAASTSTLAYATPLSPYVVKLPQDDCDPMNKGRKMIMRHRAGLIVICPNSNTQPTSVIRSAIRHELLHAMGFHPYPCYVDLEQKLFRLQTNNYYSIPRHLAMTKNPQFEWASRYVMTFTGGRVVEEARLHYNCGDLEGMPFEDDKHGPNVFRLNKTEDPLIQRLRSCVALVGHWEEYHAGNALMCPIVDPYNALSKMTATFFEDVYMYRVNRKPIKHEMSTYLYGKNYGCEFIKKGCKSWIELNQQLSTKHDRTVCSFPVVSLDALKETPLAEFGMHVPTRVYQKELCGDNMTDCYNATAVVVLMSNGFVDQQLGSHYTRIPLDPTSTHMSDLVAKIDITSIADLNPNSKDIAFIQYYTLNTPLGNDKKADSPFSVRNIGRAGMVEYCPIWFLSGPASRHHKMYGKRPSYCPTVPALTSKPHHLFNGCIQEGNTGPDYKWCPNATWTQWSECFVNASSCRKIRQLVRICESVDSSNCKGNRIEVQEEKCANCDTTLFTIKHVSFTRRFVVALLIVALLFVVFCIMCCCCCWKSSQDTQIGSTG